MDRPLTGVGSDLYRAIGIRPVIRMVLFEEGTAFFRREKRTGPALS
jgi:hypothetical protein